MQNKSFLMEMTWQEFRDTVKPDSVVLIPMGSAELEGTHLPVGVDTIAAEGLAAQLAGLPGVIIGPTIPVGYSKWFMPYPGTISLEQDTLVKLLSDYCESLIRHGVHRLVFLNSHRGNNAAIETVAHSLIASHGVKLGMLNLWKLANDLTAGKDLVAEGGFRHGGEIMTSMMLALSPDSVVQEEIKPDLVKQDQDSGFNFKNSLGDAELEGVIQTVFRDIRQVTDTGIMGDPSAASADKGQAILELIATYARQYLEEFRRL